MDCRESGTDGDRRLRAKFAGMQDSDVDEMHFALAEAVKMKSEMTESQMRMTIVDKLEL